MGFVYFCQGLGLAIAVFLIFILLRVLWSWWILPNKAYQKLRRNGFSGPIPSFPLGNTRDMTKKNTRNSSSSSSNIITHDIHSTVFPYFAKWQKSHDPEFLKKMSAGVMGKTWGKPTVFKNDREPMFGNGLVMVEGEDWVRHRHVITPAFSPTNLKAMSSLMVESTTNMLDRWTSLISSGNPEIDVEREITNTAGEIIAKTSFGMNYGTGSKVFDKLRAMQSTLFQSNRFVGVPFGKKAINECAPQQDLLGLLLAANRGDGHQGKTFTTRELIDECKTLFFGGHETTALAVSWTLLLLATNLDWQDQLREEIKQVIGDGELESTMLAKLKKMGWVMNEVLRLYSPAPNVQRQAREDIMVGDVVIPKGTNMWIDVVSMHHDKSLWGNDVFEFKPERFKDDLYGGCNHKMGFLPFGFGGRMCVGRNLSMMEYKIVLTLILTRFSFSVSPGYNHSPSHLLSLRPMHGLPLIVRPL
ncbi:hypothetical protein TEA_000980 [Camellia sinensis var. sinensis]|uniref:Cytokinin hydroxylase n=1 Tax=Camellia sinensis var. sinensis TaxID=542762 RepID=A0A4S4EXG8_CAMSN|nr:hypothetical protein TEA_000980 [Camellia sinensis var. sinensis]